MSDTLVCFTRKGLQPRLRWKRTLTSSHLSLLFWWQMTFNTKTYLRSVKAVAADLGSRTWVLVTNQLCFCFDFLSFVEGLRSGRPGSGNLER